MVGDYFLTLEGLLNIDFNNLELIFDMINIGFVQLNYSNNEMKNVSESLILSLDDE